MKIVLLLAALNAFTGNWIGTSQLGEKPTFIRVEFSGTGQNLGGMLSMPFEGVVDQPLDKVTVDGADLQFEFKNETTSFVFQGQRNEKKVSGTVTSKDRKGTFELVRTENVNAEKYFGAYGFGSGRFLYIRTWDELGENQLTYLDDEGKVGPLFALSETEFFTGPGLWIPLAAKATMIFEKDSAGRVAGMQWSEQGGHEKAVKKDALFTEQEVTFASGPVKLSGSLVLPKGNGPFPAIVLVHGSGPVTRDFFGPISYLFARHGIAVLSYDKRGVGKSEGHWMAANFTDYADDALAGVSYLRSRKEVNLKAIGLWGVSQAGWIIPQAVARDKGIAFAVLLSVPGVTPFEQEVQRMTGEMIVKQSSEEEIEKAITGLKSDINSLRTDEVRQHLEEGLQKLESEGNQKVLNASGPDNPRFLLWYTAVLDYSPVASLEQMKCPVLVLYGEADRGVPIIPNRDILENAFKNGGNNDVTFHVFPKGNHALMLSETGSMTEFPYLTQFVPGLFPTMIDWILQHTR